MAVKYFTGIDLNKNQLINVQVHVCAGVYPSNPVDGQIIYDSVEKLLKVYKSGDPGSWSPVGEPLSAGDYMSIDGNQISLKTDADLASGDILTVNGDGEIDRLDLTINGYLLTTSGGYDSITIMAGDIPMSGSDDTRVDDAINETAGAVADHIDDTGNPHNVTAGQLGGGQLSANVTATTPSQSSNDTSIATTEYVTQKFGTVDALRYKGTVAGVSDMSSATAGSGLTPAADKGDVYKVSASGLVDGVAVETGDMLICNTDGTAAATSSDYATIASSWDFIQRNVDGAVTGPASSTDGHIAVFSGATGKVVADSGATLASLSVKTASGTISSSATTATVSYSGTYVSSYVKDGSDNVVMTAVQVGAGSVTFTCGQAPGAALTCVVVYV